ncbi:hypothetical protein E2C01_072217 [Portunus trituberculatus]|uniref:Uncharacterized protein n=1 Tax=Portunus trituberculatus TaxID=210409 RepID=A0A5B7I218_PORTR|nr:hypothetical protein [Portunus trituberculatus]
MCPSIEWVKQLVSPGITLIKIRQDTLRSLKKYDDHHSTLSGNSKESARDGRRRQCGKTLVV